MCAGRPSERHHTDWPVKGAVEADDLVTDYVLDQKIGNGDDGPKAKEYQGYVFQTKELAGDQPIEHPDNLAPGQPAGLAQNGQQRQNGHSAGDQRHRAGNDLTAPGGRDGQVNVSDLYRGAVLAKQTNANLYGTTVKPRGKLMPECDRHVCQPEWFNV
ncbi:MAG: hypothetical protein Kow0031_08190 [Anaerolineae bacterium]